MLRATRHLKYLHLKFLWHYIHHSEQFSQLAEVIKEKAQPQLVRAFQILDEHKKSVPVLPDNHFERIYLAYLVIDEILKPNHPLHIMSVIGRDYSPQKQGTHEEFFSVFNDLFLEPLILFLTHQANKNFLVLGLLKKYKHRSEWFNRDELLKFAKDNKSTVEDTLKSDLYRFLFDNGLDLFIEPQSPAGNIDLIASQKNSPNKTLAEGKIFDGDKRSKSYIIKGVWQLLTHVKENNESKGYLVIYNISSKVLTFNMKQPSSPFSFCSVDNKTIYLIVIDIFNYDKTASTRGKQELVEINESDITSYKPVEKN